MAKEYLKVQTEMAYIKRNIEKLSDRLSTESQQNDIQNLEMEKVVYINNNYILFIIFYPTFHE